MDKLAKDLYFTCPQQEIHHQRTNDAFIDDVTGYTNKFVEELQGCKVIDDVLQNMQTDAKLWSTLLHISGGKLALHKCLYYIVPWIWKQQGACMVPGKDIQPKILLDDDNHPTQIKHLDCHQAHRT